MIPVFFQAIWTFRFQVGCPDDIDWIIYCCEGICECLTNDAILFQDANKFAQDFYAFQKMTPGIRKIHILVPFVRGLDSSMF